MKMHLNRKPGMSPIETRKSLIVRLKSDQNEIAWRDFVVVYEGFLGQMARRHGVPERHVADVTQQILLAIVRSIEGWKDDGNNASFRRWLSTVSRNVVIRFMTRERRQPAGVGGSDLIALLQKLEEKPSELHIQQYQHELIVWAAEHVRKEFIETSWQAFWATVIDQKSVDEVARDLNVSAGSIYMSRSRIMAKIRKTISIVLENE
jgi:RNA polymerase sigma-70 factor, ECF subfamily